MEHHESRPIWYSGVPFGFWTQSKNRRAYMEWLERRLRIREPEDWYDLTAATLRHFGGSGMLSYYGECVSALVIDYVPWYDWKEWLFPRCPKGFWADPHNRRRYLEWLGEKLGFREPDDWYRLRLSDLRENQGHSMIRLFGGPGSIVKAVFPEVEWYPWRFEAVPRRYWHDPANVRRYYGWLAKRLGFEKMEDWYRLLVSDLAENHGISLVSKHGSAAAAVMAAFPEYEWREWLFTSTPVGFWNDTANVRRYLEWLGDRLGFTEPEDWYGLRIQDVKKNCGAALRVKYHESPPALVAAAFPEYDWQEWWFDHPPKHFWDNPANGRRYLEWLGKELGFKEMEDWYRIRVTDFEMRRGRGLLVRFRFSPIAVLTHFFPDYPWQPWKLGRIDDKFWDNPTHCRRYLEWLGEELGYEKPEDWYQLTGRSFTRHRGLPLLSRYGSSPVTVLKTFMPEHDWKEWLFHRRPRDFWSDRENRRRYLEWLAEVLEIRDADGWGRLRLQQLKENHGRPLLKVYRSSIRDLILDTFPKSHPAVKGTRPTRETKSEP